MEYLAWFGACLACFLMGYAARYFHCTDQCHQHIREWRQEQN